MIGTISHVIIVAVIQLIVGYLTGNYWFGAIFGTAYYLGREVAQAEDRWVKEVSHLYEKALWQKARALDPRAWNTKSVLDWVLPMVVTVAIAVVAK